MKTSTQTATDALQDALSNPTYKVIALTGKWGTGKTHLWRTLKTTRKDALEISAFGVKNIEEIKRKLFQDSIKTDKTSAKDIAASIIKALEAIPKKFFGLSISDAALTVLPLLVKGKTIIIDDVERKNKSLDISELLGLIYEYTQKFNARFLLILNTDSLEDKQIWQSLHEKIIDKEIVLNPSPECSFKVAAAGLDTAIIPFAKDIIVEYKIQNVRIIKKTLLAVMEILSKQGTLPEALYKSHVPMLTFLGICHYRGLSNGLTLDNIANYIFKQPNDTEDEKVNRIIAKSPVHAGKLTELAIDYLRFGVITHEDVTLFFEPLKTRTDYFEFKSKFEDFINDLNWRVEQKESDVREFVNSLDGKIYNLEAEQISRLFADLNLHGHSGLADKVLSEWLEMAELDTSAYKKLEYIYEKHAPKKLWDFKTKLVPPEEATLTLKEIIQRHPLKEQLTQKSINALSSSTEREYETILNSLTNTELKDFVELHFRMGEGREDHWRSAQKSFIAACENISNNTPESRLGRILYRELSNRRGT